jgi:hypothetical protein
MAQLTYADSTWVYSVQVSASVQTSPPSITLSWPADPFGPSSYTVYRKSKNAGSWNSVTSLPGNATSYVDNNVAVGAAYEYQIVKAGSGYTGYGYIYAGIKAPLIDRRGKVILIVENSAAANLSTELARLKRDLIGDGWTVLRHDVSRGDNPAHVKALIVGDYNADPQNVEAAFLFGHVPIFRCGNLNVDGHQSRPMPADAYYGDMDGGWDNPDYLPSDVELMVGRVDLWNMPGNGASSPWGSEMQMLRNYLDKDHHWRHNELSVPSRALLGNRFGDFNGEAFAASGFRNFDALVGPGRTSIANEQDNAPVDQRWSSMLQAGTYLWAYGCGGGSYTSMSGMGTHGNYNDIWSADIVGQDARAVFFMMFGSWLGEWDSTDNLMRSVLATPSLGLTCSWAGRPHWFYHHMGLGEPIGHSALVTMNNGGLYRNQVNNFARGVHIALMGDPTLRMHPVAPPGNLSASLGSGGAVLSWTPSSDPVSGYHVYRAATASGPFSKLTSSLIGGSSYTDASVTSGTYTYMVRAVALESSPSGTYFNPSQGVFATVSGSGGGGDDDPPSLPIVTVTAVDPYGDEAGAEPAAFKVTRSGQATAQLTVNFTLSGSAVNGADYRTLQSFVTIPAGAAAKTIMVEPIGDVLSEGTERVTLTLSTGSGYAVGSSRTAEISIADNDVRAPQDNVPPTVAVIAPLPKAVVSGTSVLLSALANDNVGVTGVRFRIDGIDLPSERSTSPYRSRWNSRLVSNGPHQVAAVARDAAGNSRVSAPVTVTVSNPRPVLVTKVWVEDKLPAGAIGYGEGGDRWSWVSSARYSGAFAHRSNLANGLHQHYFDWASATLNVKAGDRLFAYVYLDPANPPKEVMLQWNDGSWDHRAYWGLSLISYGEEGTVSQRRMGALPPTGKWVKLQVPAALVGLEDKTIRGMAFTLYGGRATWDRAGKLVRPE